jgi:hypothetical protein
MTHKRTLFAALVVALLLGLCPGVFADVIGTATIDVVIDVNAVAAIVVTGTDLSFTVGGAPAAGALPIIADLANAPTYLQYTSVVGAAETRTIAVQADAAVPPGLRLNIRAGIPTGNGGVGTPVAGGVVIDSTYTGTTDLTIITGITSCATGIGATQGAPIYYTLAIDEATFDDLDTTATTATITLTYTLVGL